MDDNEACRKIAALTAIVQTMMHEVYCAHGTVDARESFDLQVEDDELLAMAIANELGEEEFAHAFGSVEAAFGSNNDELSASPVLPHLRAGQRERARVALLALEEADHAHTVDGDVVTISASIAASVIEALLNEYVGETERVRSAIEALVSESADEPNGQLLARALAAFAVSRSGGDSAVVAAIVDGVTAGQPALSVEDVPVVLVVAAADVDAGRHSRSPLCRRSSRSAQRRAARVRDARGASFGRSAMRIRSGGS